MEDPTEDARTISTRAEQQLRVFSHAAALLASSLQLDDTLAHTISAYLPAIGDFGFLDVIIDKEVRRTVRAYNDLKIEALLRPTQWIRQEPSGMNLCALSSGRAALHTGIDDEWYCAVALSDEHLALLRQLAFRSMITVPMHFRGELIGALTLFMGRSGRMHSAADLDFAKELALLAAPVVMNALLLETQRQAQDALRLSEERLRLAADAGQLGVWDWDIPGNRVTWSDHVYELHGMQPGGFGERVEDFAALIHPDDRADVERRLNDALQGKGQYAAEFRTTHPDGSLHWLSTRATLLRDDQGAPLRMVGVTFDVTERVGLLSAERKARGEAEAARRREGLLAAASNVLSQSLQPDQTLRAIAPLLVPRMADWCRVDLIDDTGAPQPVLIYHANPALSQRGTELAKTWRAPASLRGSICWVIENKLPSLRARIREQDLQMIDDPGIVEIIKELRLCATLCVPLVARGRTLGALLLAQAESGRGFNKDDLVLLTELAQRAALALDNARLYAEAEHARQEAETASRTKDEFLAMLGHELRNPLAPIMTALELMELRGDQSTRYEQGVIKRQIEHLSRLVDDLLDMSRITRGKIVLKPKYIDISAVLDKAIELVRPALERNRLRLHFNPPAHPLYVEADEVRLTQVFGNLLSNAAKFTPPDGEVTITVMPVDGHVEVIVKDTGIGMPPELLEQVFDLFVQGPQHIDRQAGGLGLGLTIAKTLVNMHGGSIRAESPGALQGSTFYVTLPCTSASPVSLPAHTDVPALPASARILIVDDNADAGETLAAMLISNGFDVRYASDGPQALQLIERFAPELAILDIGLPAMDGYQLAQHLRTALSAPDLPLIALTGYGRDPDLLHAKAAGFNRHLTKPVTPATLLATIGELLTYKQHQ